MSIPNVLHVHGNYVFMHLHSNKQIVFGVSLNLEDDMLYRVGIMHIYHLGRGCGVGTDILIFEKILTDMI